MNLKFRFDPSKSVIHYRADDTETECTFTQAVQQINQLAANLPVINDLVDKAEDRIRKGTKEKGLHEAVRIIKMQGIMARPARLCWIRSTNMHCIIMRRSCASS